MIKCVSLLCEILTIMILMHSLLGRKWKRSVKTVVFIAVSIGIFHLINMNILSVYLQFVPYLFLCLYLRDEFSEDGIFKIARALLCTVFVLFGMQILAYYIVQSFRVRVRDEYLINVAILVCVLMLTKIFDMGKLYQYITKTKLGMRYIVLGCGTLFITLLMVLKLNRSFSLLEIFLIVCIFLIVIICFFQWKAQHDIITMKEREVKWLTQCNDSFEQLIADVRSRQHEFNSQIDAICGMQYSCATYEELVQHINLYSDKIIRENRFNRLLTLECPPILKGFLYYRFCKAHTDGIGIDYEIVLDEEIDLYIVFDIAEIVGILFDNACEALNNRPDSRPIFVSIRQAQDKVCVLVENISAYIPHQEIVKFTKRGYSTKGTSRGYGLYNVRNIAKKYDGELTIENKEKAGENWLRISVDLITAR